MSTPSPDGVKQELDAGKMKIGNVIVDANGFPITPSSPVFADSSSKLAVGAPFPLFAGAANTGFALLALEGNTTLSANAILTGTIVAGASGSLTTAGFMRITVIDDAGNLTNGAYYIPFGTLA